MQPQSGSWQYGGAPGPVPPPGAGEPLRPSGWWYGLAGVIGVGGVGVAIFLLVSSIGDLWDKVDDFARVEVPGEETVFLDDTGGYTIYHEFDGASDDFALDPFVDVTLTGPDGEDIELDPYDAEVTYTTPGDHEGVALYSFDVDEVGEYTLSAEGESGAVAIGPGIGGELVRRILTGTGIGFISLVLCAVIAIVTGVRRGQARRRRFVAATPNYWPGGGPPPPGGSGVGPPPGQGQYPSANPPPPYQPPGRPSTF